MHHADKRITWRARLHELLTFIRPIFFYNQSKICGNKLKEHPEFNAGETPHGTECLRVQIHHSFDASLKPLWHSLQESMDCYVFQTYEWLAHWQSTIGQPSCLIEPTIATVTDSQQPLAIFPFGIRRVAGIRVLEFLGGGQNDYNAPLILPEVLAAGMLGCLWIKVLDALPKHDARYFVRMPERVGSLRNSFLDVVPSFCEGFAYAAALPCSWNEFRVRLPGKFQKDNARMIRRLSEIGQLEFAVTDSDAEFNRIVDILLAQKERRYLETGAQNILADAHTRNFYRSLMGQTGENAHVHLSALILGNEVLAAHLGMLYRDRFYYLFPAFVGGTWTKFSPGRLLLENLVQWAISHRFRVFDFTTGGEAYKSIWCNSEMPLHRTVVPLTLRGRVFAMSQALIYWIKHNRRARTLAMKALRIFGILRQH